MSESIKYADFFLATGNLGDSVQLLALELIYERMGIGKNDVIHFTVDNALEIIENTDCHFVLPMVASELIYLSLFNIIPYDLLKKRFTLIPISIGVTRFDFVDENHLNEFRHFIDLFESPIGCREHDTAVMHEKLGYRAYVNGCITNTFPKRKEGNYNTVFLIDVPESVLSFIPENIANKAVKLSNVNLRNDGYSQYLECKERYDCLRDNASLIITGRYHIAHPCNAMGIPVIYICGFDEQLNDDIRLSSMNPRIPCYTKDQFEKINWSPITEDYEEEKKEMISLITERIRNAYNTVLISKKLETFYLPNKERFYDICSQNLGTIILHYIYPRMDLYLYFPFLSGIKESFSYYLFGISNKGDINGLRHYIKTKCPDSSFVGFIDSNKSAAFGGEKVYSPNEFVLDDKTYVIVSALSANKYAENLFKERNLNINHLIKLPPEVCWYYYNGLLSPKQ